MKKSDERVINKEIQTELTRNPISKIPINSTTKKSDNDSNFNDNFIIPFMKKNKMSLIAISFTYLFSTLIVISNGIIFYFLSQKLYSKDKEEVILNGQILFGVYVGIGFLASAVKAYQK